MRRSGWLALAALLAVWSPAALAQRGHGGGGMGTGGGGRHGGGAAPSGSTFTAPAGRSGGAHVGGPRGAGAGRFAGTTPGVIVSTPNFFGSNSGFGNVVFPGTGHAPGTFHPTPNFFGSTSGFGNVVFPGTGHAPGTFSPFSIVDPTFGTRLTETVSGFGPNFGHRGRGGATTIVIPYGVPVYVPYAEPQPQPPQIIYVIPGSPAPVAGTPPEAPSGGVVTYIVPPRRTETTEPAAPAQRLWLIALKNHSIYSATEYWMENDTLHYLTPYGAHNQATLDQVDVDFTVQLNRERGLDFRIEK